MSARSVCQRFSFVVLLILLSVLVPAGSPPVVAQQPQAAPDLTPRSFSVTFIENVGRLDPRVRSWMDGNSGRAALDLAFGSYDDEFSTGTLD